MSVLGFYGKLYKKLASQYLKQRMQYRADFICELVGIFFVSVFEILGFWVIFQTTKEIGGWSYYEVIFLYGFGYLAMSVQQCMLDNAWGLSYCVVTGEFIKYSFRPINILFYYMSEQVDIKGFVQFITGIVLIVISWVKLDIPVTPLHIAAFFIFWINSVFVCMGLMILSSVTSFLGGGTNESMNIATNLKEYGRYPLTIYGKVLRGIFTFLLPIGYIAYYPCSYFLGGKGYHPIYFVLSPVISFLFFFIACKCWIFFANRYAGTGT